MKKLEWRSTTSDVSRADVRWVRAWWTADGSGPAYIFVFKGYLRKYYICTHTPFTVCNRQNVGPFRTLKAAKVMYVLLHGGSL